MSSLKLYWNKLCPFVHRAWIAAIEKSVPIELVYIPLDTEAPEWYKKINPRETVPTLEHNGKYIFESMFIVQYIDETFAPVNSLYPGGAATRYQVNYFIEQVGEELIGTLYGFLRDPSEENQKAAVEALKYINGLLEKQSEGPFFLGNTFSAADVAIVPFLDRFSQTLPAYHNFNLFEHAPRLEKQLRAALQRTSVGQTSQPAEEYLKGYTSYAKKPIPSRKYKLYSSPSCPFAERARLAAALKGVEHEIIDLDLNAERPAWYLAINPSGSVPTLVTPDNEIIKESALIVSYFQERFPETGASLRHNDATARYDGRFFLDNASNFRNGLFGFLFDQGSSEKLNYMNEQADILSALLNKQSPQGPFFYGENITEVDINVVTFLLRAHSVRNDVPAIGKLFADHPRLLKLVTATREHAVTKNMVLPEEGYRTFFLPYITKQ